MKFKEIEASLGHLREKKYFPQYGELTITRNPANKAAIWELGLLYQGYTSITRGNNLRECFENVLAQQSKYIADMMWEKL